MLIRKATINDLAAIAAVEAECFPAAEAATAAEFADRLEHYADCFWLLLENDRLIGFVDGMLTDSADLDDAMYADASLHKPDGRWQMIFGLNTLAAYRCHGCAAMLMECVIKAARDAGRLGVVLTCKDALVHYYAKFGFIDEGVSQSTHGDVVWHQMRLRF